MLTIGNIRVRDLQTFQLSNSRHSRIIPFISEPMRDTSLDVLLLEIEKEKNFSLKKKFSEKRIYFFK